MGKIIENPKSYSGRELETIFFRPMLSGPDAIDLGIKVMYNMPVPTTLNFWHRPGDVLAPYTKGWAGGNVATKFQKTINLSKVKAELGFSASDYFGTIKDLIASNSDVNMDDLTGTELEAAETQLFRQAIAESIRATMWLGDKTRTAPAFKTFDGFLKCIKADLRTATNKGDNYIANVKIPAMTGVDASISLFERMWGAADERLKSMKDEGNLVILCTGDILTNYEDHFKGMPLESGVKSTQNGTGNILWNGIPVKDVKVGSYLPALTDMPQSFAILTDKRNLALSVNTDAFPGMEVRMWYNPDEMENRQRAIFMAGTEYLLPELIVAAVEKEV